MPNKDILITREGIFYNFVRSVDTLCDDGQYHYVQTQDFRDDSHFVADLKTMGSAKLSQLWEKVTVEISISIMEFATYHVKTGVSDILDNLTILEPVLYNDTENLYINIFLPAVQDLDTPSTSIDFYKISSLRTLQRLVKRLEKFRSLKSCIICLRVPPPPKLKLDTEWLSHAIPFEKLRCAREVKWQIPSSPPMLLCEHNN